MMKQGTFWLGRHVFGVTMWLVIVACLGVCLYGWWVLRGGVVVAEVTDNTWTYRIRGYPESPFETSTLTDVRFEVARKNHIFDCAQPSTPDPRKYQSATAMVILTNGVAAFQIGDHTTFFIKQGSRVVWSFDEWPADIYRLSNQASQVVGAQGVPQPER